METAVIIFFITVGLVIIVPVLMIIIDSIRKHVKRKKAKTHEFQRTNDKSKQLSGTVIDYNEKSRFFDTNVYSSENYGENQIYECLRDYEYRGCKFLFNAYLPKNNGETTEIDVLMISSKGIFVFECKNFNGSVNGSGKDEYWTQTKLNELGESVTKRFYSPIKQNDVHVLSLREKINNKYPIYSVVVFSGNCELIYNGSSDDCDTWVVSINDLNDTVEVIFKYMQSDMSDDDIERVYNLLYPYTQTSQEMKMRHIQDIKGNYSTESGLF